MLMAMISVQLCIILKFGGGCCNSARILVRAWIGWIGSEQVLGGTRDTRLFLIPWLIGNCNCWKAISHCFGILNCYYDVIILLLVVSLELDDFLMYCVPDSMVILILQAANTNLQ